MQKIRSETKVPCPASGEELHAIEMTTLPVYNKVYIMSLVQHVLGKIKDCDPSMKLMTHREMLLALPSVETQQDKKYSKYDSMLDARIEELVSFAESLQESRLPARISREQIVNHEYYMPDTLAPLSTLIGINTFFEDEQKRIHYQNAIDKACKWASGDRDLRMKIEEFFRDRLENAFPLLFLADKIVLHVGNHTSEPDRCSWSSANKSVTHKMYNSSMSNELFSSIYDKPCVS